MTARREQTAKMLLPRGPTPASRRKGASRNRAERADRKLSTDAWAARSKLASPQDF